MRWPGLAETVWVFARFDGRIGREAYWLANIALIALLYVVIRPYLVVTESEISIETSVLPVGALLVGAVSSLAVAAKRLHDLNLNGLIAFLLVVPIVSIVAMIVLGLLRGNPGPNRYGRAADRLPE